MTEQISESNEWETQVALLKNTSLVEGYFYSHKSYRDLNDADIAHLLLNVRKLQSESENVDDNGDIAVVNEFLNGAALPITEQLTVEQERNIHFCISEVGSAAYFNPNAVVAKGNRYQLITLKSTELGLGFHDPHLVITRHNRKGQVVARAPVWVIAYLLGVEEGAHAAFHQKVSRYAIPSSTAEMSRGRYAAHNIEYDGLLWRLVALELLLEDGRISEGDKAGIREMEMILKEIKSEADSYRRKRGAKIFEPADIRRKYSL